MDQMYSTFTILYNRIYSEVFKSKNKHKYLPHDFIEILINCDSKFYNILWSKTLAINLYDEHIKGQSLDKSIGTKLIECILKHGGTKSALDMCTLYSGINEELESECNNDSFLQYDLKKFDKEQMDIQYDNKFEDSVSNNFYEIIDD
jgi:hypothetical protein